MNKFTTRALTLLMPDKKARKDFRQKHKYDGMDNDLIRDYIFDNSNNPKCYSLMNSLNTHFMHKNIFSMEDFVLNRITPEVVKSSVFNIQKKHPDKKLLLLTNCQCDCDCKKIEIDEIKNYKNVDEYIFVVGYSEDFLSQKALRAISQLNGGGLKAKYEVIEQALPLCKYLHTDEFAHATLVEEWKKTDRREHFCPVDFENIFQALKQTQNLEGDYVEIGVFQGASARAALNYMKRANIKRKAYFLDTYEGFTYDEASKSEDIRWKDTHKETSLEGVKKFLSGYENINVIKSNIISDELPCEIEKIAVANIDVDMYEAVKAALYKVKDKVVQYGFIIAEDFGHTPGLIGGQKAVYEFLEENKNQFISLLSSGGQMMMIKK